MNKMQMAHQMALELVKIKPSLSAWQIADRCFEYADAMQAEADKREDKTRPEVLEEWQPDTYPEYEHGRDYPSDAWVTFNGKARLAVSIREDLIRKRPQ